MGTAEGHAEVQAIGFLPFLVFSVPTERAAITAGDDLKGFGDMSPTSILEGFTVT